MRIKVHPVKLSLALSLALVIGLFAGFAEELIDRSNYLDKFYAIQASHDLATQLWEAKDVLFLAVVLLVSALNGGPTWVFMILATSSLVLKVKAFSALDKRHTLSLTVLYLIFLAPGLEFAAIRSALGISFALVAFAFRKNILSFAALGTLAAGAHVSMIAPLAFIRGHILRAFSRQRWLVALLLAASSAYAFQWLGIIISRATGYIGNTGTIRAYALPLATLLSARMVFIGSDAKTDNQNRETLQGIRNVIYGLVALSFGLTAGTVTVAVRLLEVSWVFLLVAVLNSWRRNFAAMSGGALFLALLIYVNFSRGTWRVIIAALP